MKLAKPPVIEAWIDFRFVPGEDAPAWDRRVAADFLRQSFGGRYTPRDYLIRTEFAVPVADDLEVAPPRSILERTRAVNDDEDRFLQVGRDVLIFNLLRKEHTWPEYPVLRDEALRAYDEYVAATTPISVKSISLHYRDVVTVPFGSDREILPANYLRVYPEFPKESFGPVSDFLIGVTLPRLSSTGVVKLIVKTEPATQQCQEHDTELQGRFRMDWNVAAEFHERLARESVCGWLEGAHEDLLRAFRSAFTQEGWKLFDPKEEG